MTFLMGIDISTTATKALLINGSPFKKCWQLRVYEERMLRGLV
jgi:sugar (pentulose or hexulose) kinase